MKCTLTGDLTIVAAAKVRSDLLQALAGTGPFEVDTVAVTDVDAAGLQLLLAAFKSAVNAKVPILFPPQAHGPAVAAGLDLLGLRTRDWNREDKDVAHE